ncbi:DUF86 domain-containing protein [Candidatus Roizmanbacteria bacterium]|nr:DUF86 domain-containing protein [Candidatus Roizmanbacteria bacterium]
MTNIEVLKNKLSEIQKYLNIIKDYQNKNKEDLIEDQTLRGAVERYLYLLCQSAIDFSEALISHLNFRYPSTYGEIFEILQEQKIISQEIALKMKKMTGFRNILTHAYGEVNLDIVLTVLQKDSKDFTLFIKEIEGKIKI